MTITILYPSSGYQRVHKGMSQGLINILITQLSKQNEIAFVPVVVIVTEDNSALKMDYLPNHHELVRLSDHINEQQMG